MQFSDRLMQQLGMATCALVERDTARIPQNQVRPGFPWGRRSDVCESESASLVMRLRRRIERLESEIKKERAEVERLKGKAARSIDPESGLLEELHEYERGLRCAVALIGDLSDSAFSELMDHEAYGPFVSSVDFLLARGGKRDA